MKIYRPRPGMVGTVDGEKATIAAYAASDGTVFVRAGDKYRRVPVAEFEVDQPAEDARAELTTTLTKARAELMVLAAAVETARAYVDTAVRALGDGDARTETVLDAVRAVDAVQLIMSARVVAMDVPGSTVEQARLR